MKLRSERGIKMTLEKMYDYICALYNSLPSDMPVKVLTRDIGSEMIGSEWEIEGIQITASGGICIISEDKS